MKTNFYKISNAQCSKVKNSTNNLMAQYIRPLLVLLLFLIGQSLTAQVEKGAGSVSNRIPPPDFPLYSMSQTGANSDAPAGSISVAESAVYNAYTPEQLVQNVLVTGCLTASNVRFGYYNRNNNNAWVNHTWSSTPGNRQLAYFSKGNSTFPLNEGLLLCTGRASSAMGPNNNGGRSDQMVSNASDPDLVTITGRTMYDAAILEFDFVPAGDSIEFTFVFASEEYLEYCETQYNDAFGFFLSGPGISGPYSNNAVNLALIPGTTIPVSINTIHPAGTNVNGVNYPAENAEYYYNNPSGSLTMQYDGGTVTLKAKYAVQPCSTYRIRMSIADASDQQWDAGVFLGARSFNSQNIAMTNYALTNFGNYNEGQTNTFEGCSGYLRIDRSGSDISMPNTVNLTLTGTATNGVDIQTTGNQPFPAQINFPANVSFVDIPYTIINDGNPDNSETFIIQAPLSCPCDANQIFVNLTLNLYEQYQLSSVSALNVTCNGQNNGTITVNATGGSGSYLYSINNGTTWQTLNIFTGLAAGTYTVLVREPGSCYADVSATATIGSPVAIIANAGPDVTICNGESTQLNGTGGVLYSWSPATGLNYSNIPNPIASPSATTTYTLTVTNAAGLCASTDQVVVTVNALATFTASATSVTCNGGNNGSITVTPLAGVIGDYEYSNNDGASYQSGNTFNNLTSGSYLIKIRNLTTGCESDHQVVQVTEPTPLTGSYTATAIECNGGVSTVTITATGGTPPYVGTGVFQQSAVKYVYTIYDAAGCSRDVTVILTEPQKITPSVISVTNIECGGQNTGGFSISASNGVAPYTFSLAQATGTQCVSVDETWFSGTNANLNAPAGMVFARVDFASFGLPDGVCPDFTLTACHSSRSQSVVESYLLGNNSASIPAGDYIFGDPCPGSIKRLSINATYASLAGISNQTGVFSNLAAGSYIVLVEDVNGCRSSITVNLSEVDTTSPTWVTLPGALDATFECSDLAGIAIAQGLSPIAQDENDPSLTYQKTSGAFVPGSCPNAGTYTNTWIASDDCGFTSPVFTQVITVQDVTDPVLTVPADVTVECSAVPVVGTATATDNCDTEVTVTYEGEVRTNGSCADSYTLTRTWKAVDNCGNESTASQVITVQDVTDPVLTVPADVTVECSAVPVVGTATATDNCDTEVTVTYEGEVRTNGSCADSYTLTRTWKAVDNCGNESTASQVITVQDVTAPTFTGPADITISKDENCGYNADPSITGMPTNIIDNCDPSPIVSYTDGSCFDNSTTESMNAGRGYYYPIQISGYDDITAGQLQKFEMQFYTNKGKGNVEFLLIAPNGDGIILVGPYCEGGNCDLNDAATYRPSFYASSSNYPQWNNNNAIPTGPGNFTPYGASSTTNTSTITGFNGNFRNSFEDLTGPMNGTWVLYGKKQGTGLGVVRFEGACLTPVGCENDELIIRKWTVTDHCGNTSAPYSQIIHVHDDMPPVLTVPGDTTVSCENIPEVGIVTATDNCDTDVTITYLGETRVDGACEGSFSLTRSWRAVDNCGNETTDGQVITVVDVTAPTITTPAADLTVECDGLGNTAQLNAWLASNGGAVASDICSNVTWTNNFEALSDLCGNTGAATVIFTATDDCGNFSTTSATFTIIDVTAPTITTPASDLTVECDGLGNTAQLTAWLASHGGAVASDICSNVTWTNNFEALSDLCGNTGAATVIFTATDDCGNFSTTSATFTIIDVTAPTITTPAADLTVECDGLGNTAQLNAWLASHGGAVASDICSNVTWTNNFEALSDLCGNTGAATVIFTATDDCGNFSTTSATFTIIDVTAPVVTCPENITVNNDPGLCSAYVTVPQPGYVEACGSVILVNSINQTANASGVYQVGTTSVTWIVTDECGNSSSCSMTVTVVDNEAPVITCPESLVLCDTEPVVLGQATATDNCGIQSITNNAPATFPVGITNVTWTALDIHGNTSTCIQTVTIIAHPTANAGPDEVICQANNFTVTGATATNYASVLWTHNGQGVLQNASTLTPTYVPQIGETGNITLTLTVYANAPCANATDQMLLSILPQPAATAGENATICGGETFVPVTAWASNYNSILWTTSGTGTFDNPAILHPTYTPSQADINNGSVILTLTAYGNEPCGDISDPMTLTIIPSPTANAGSDAATCEGTPYTVTGASASNYTSLLWSHNGTGNLTNASTLTPTYTPATGETGTVVLTLTVTGNGSCGEATDAMTLTINVEPQAFAGPDAITCASAPYTLSEATASVQSVNWTTSGTGTFDNASLLNATYTPSAADIASGSVTLTLHAIGIAPCVPALDAMVLTIQPATYAFAGEDATICNNTPYTVDDASALGYTSILWSHNGTGSLANETTLTPTYTPGVNETGVVILTMTVTGAEPCGNASASVQLTLQPALSATAGADLYTCETAPILISLSAAQNYTAVNWTTSGTGSFDNAAIVNPTYTPTEADMTAGSVVLTLHATGFAPCGDIEDAVILTINQSPMASAGADASVCQGASYTLSGATATNYSSILWTSNGTGTLTDANTLTPTYTPGTGETGTVVLTLTVNGPGACGSVIATDQMNLVIFESPVANAGADQVVAFNGTTILNGSATGGSGLYGWSWQPSELLVNASVASTVTNPITETTTFILTVLDMTSGCTSTDEMIVTLTGNNPPVAIDDYDTTSIDEPIVIRILANDYDPDGDNITPSLLTQPEHGTVILNEDGTVSYTPAAGFFGIDSFIYQICDDGQPSLCDTAVVRILILGSREDLIFYNGISPNGDGLNDKWIIGNIEYFHDNEVIIFNRWGDIVYSCFYYDNKGVAWDGTYDKTGNPVPDGTYFYIVTVPGVGKYDGWILVRGNK